MWFGFKYWVSTAFAAFVPDYLVVALQGARNVKVVLDNCLSSTGKTGKGDV